MNWWEANIEPVILHPTVAGVFGSLLSLRFVPGDTWMGRFFSFGTGVALAVYGAPLGIQYLEIKSSAGPPAFGFLAGFIGMNLLAKLWDAVNAFDWRGLFTLIVSRRVAGPAEGPPPHDKGG